MLQYYKLNVTFKISIVINYVTLLINLCNISSIYKRNKIAKSQLSAYNQANYFEIIFAVHLTVIIIVVPKNVDNYVYLYI